MHPPFDRHGIHTLLWLAVGSLLASCVLIDEEDPLAGPSAPESDPAVPDTGPAPDTAAPTDSGNASENGDTGEEDATPLADLGIGFAAIAPGTYEVGCLVETADHPCHFSQLPVMPVELTRGFRMMTTEVTQHQYETLMGDNPSYWPTADCADCPVNDLSWHQAAAFANALSDLAAVPSCYACGEEADGLRCTAQPDLVACDGFRLPTEAEWEIGARCGTERFLFAGSDTLNDVAWTNENAEGTIHPVGQKQANGCGIHDLSGNVWEWVHDLSVDDYYRADGRTDPSGPETGNASGDRGSRGGSAYQGRDEALVRLRRRYGPVGGSSHGGFRVVWSGIGP